MQRQRAMVWSIVATLFVSASPVSAAINSFTPLGPDAGEVLKVAFHPTNASIAYAATHAGFFRSIDGGETWAVAPCTRNHPIADFAVDPNNGDRVVIGVLGLTLAVTTDAGASCSTLGEFPAAHLNPADNVEFGSDGTLYIIALERLYRSADGGSTWQERTAKLSWTDRLRVDPQNSNELYTYGPYGGFRSTDGGMSWSDVELPDNTDDLVILAVAPATQKLLTSTATGLWSSIDAGATWESVGTPNTMVAFAVDPSDSNVLYAGVTPSALIRSEDGGAVWTPVASDARTNNIKSIAVNPIDPNVILISSYSGLLRSADRGANWQLANAGITAAGIEKIVAAPGSGDIYVLTQFLGIYALDREAKWATAVDLEALTAVTGPSGLLAFDLLAIGEDADELLIGKNQGFARSRDGGHAWEWVSAAGHGGLDHISVASSQSDDILVSSSLGVARSIDDGATWTPAIGLPPASTATRFGRAPSSPQIVYAGIRDAGTPKGLYKSIDGGSTWVNSNGSMPLSYVMDIEVDPRSAQTVYVRSESGAFKSTDGGASWTALQFDAAGVSRIAISSARPNTLFAGYGGRIARSLDAGASWQDVYVPQAQIEEARHLFVDPLRPNTLFASFPNGLGEMTLATDIALDATLPPSFPTGESSTATYTIRNRGPLHASEVRASFQLPASADAIGVQGAPSECTVQGSTVTCVYPILSATDVEEVLITFTNRETDELELVATVESLEADLDVTNNTLLHKVSSAPLPDPGSGGGDNDGGTDGGSSGGGTGGGNSGGGSSGGGGGGGSGSWSLIALLMCLASARARVSRGRLAS